MSDGEPTEKVLPFIVQTPIELAKENKAKGIPPPTIEDIENTLILRRCDVGHDPVNFSSNSGGNVTIRLTETITPGKPINFSGFMKDNGITMIGRGTYWVVTEPPENAKERSVYIKELSLTPEALQKYIETQGEIDFARLPFSSYTAGKLVGSFEI